MDKWSINYSWSQPYSLNPAYTTSEVHDEMIRIEAVDNIVQNLLTYPDAERIINTVKTRRGKHD